ncbi:hypothetical protein [Pseudomonas sp. ZS001]|uniref:hypothetical protein n=1 Tax=Pseudomonas sp. ZS001 TaxID=3138070 RepID=UPI0031389940
MHTVDDRVAALEQAVNTISAATLNALGAIIKATTKLEALDRQALWDELEGAKSVSVQNGNQAQYLHILSLFQQNIS